MEGLRFQAVIAAVRLVPQQLALARSRKGEKRARLRERLGDTPGIDAEIFQVEKPGIPTCRTDFSDELGARTTIAPEMGEIDDRKIHCLHCLALLPKRTRTRTAMCEWALLPAVAGFPL